MSSGGQHHHDVHRASLLPEGVRSDNNNNSNSNNNNNNNHICSHNKENACHIPSHHNKQVHQDALIGKKHSACTENWASPPQERRVSLSTAPHTGRMSVQRSAIGRQSTVPSAISREKKSAGRRWLSTLKLSVWITTVFTLVFAFFYFFLHVLLMVRVWDPVHESNRDTQQIISEISRELSRDRLAVSEDEDDNSITSLPPLLPSEHTDDHRHSREKSIMSLTLILVLSFHSITFYLVSTTLASCIRTIDQFVLRSPPPRDGLDNLSIETLYYRLSGHHPPQAFEARSRARSRIDEEMGVSKSKRRALMLSFFGLVLALLALLVLVMVQLVFCIALYSPFMDLMDCLLLIFSCAIMCCSIAFIFAASYFHRKTLYY